ncbi:ArsR/SmtB family transcription factor [Haloarchaeobius amylolyticus]|uniref:ArsR/SmtB family transcription factor n=1 Tax=Haloarchaeobius amylolyticus TaxID=1198296 RepID=UPI002270682D
MSDEQDADAVLELLGDEYVRDILAATSERPHSARELGEVCGSSRSTVYRRVDDLLEHDLLVEGTRIDDDGSHVNVYEAALEGLELELDDGHFAIDLDVKEDAAWRFTRLWEDIKNS